VSSIYTFQADKNPLRLRINEAYLGDETSQVKSIIRQLKLDSNQQAQIEQMAKQLVIAVRHKSHTEGGINAFLQEYDLSSHEGVILLCLAEALLRIPDQKTADCLIRDKLVNADWEKHLGKSHSLFVNASTWALMLTGRISRQDEFLNEKPFATVSELISRISEPVVRASLQEAMRIMGDQFVMGKDIAHAISRSQNKRYKENLYSYDMLGEAALGATDAEYFFAAYQSAISQIKVSQHTPCNINLAPSISIKLSALHPRFELAQRVRVMQELVPKLTALAEMACESNIALTIDAEEADRLDLMLDIFEAVYVQPQFKHWQGMGIVVQAYQKRALTVIDWLINLAKIHGRCIPLRLVKGAYWDSEIKWAQEQGLADYPVFTRKEYTDLSYITCVQKLFTADKWIFPQFATHNARTLATVLSIFSDIDTFEIQRLQGMGELLFTEVRKLVAKPPRVRVYAPVGAHRELLPYLVRRLLENGANTSFINKIGDTNIDIDKIIFDPLQASKQSKCLPHASIPLPKDIFRPNRINSAGVNLCDIQQLQAISDSLQAYGMNHYKEDSNISGGENLPQSDILHTKNIYSPSNSKEIVGHYASVSEEFVSSAFDSAVSFSDYWRNTSVDSRADCLYKVADLIEENSTELLYLCVKETGKCIADGLAEIRESVDFCRYYAQLAQQKLMAAEELIGPTGEQNSLILNGRGVFVCISPWNFPLAIFCGQIAAALVSGNCVIAKPASDTPLIAAKLIRLFQQAGVPDAALQLLICSSELLSKTVLNDARLAGVAFTGSTQTARKINIQLAKRDGPIIPFIAETGGINTMIVESSALPQQVVIDVIKSSFNSAGQRCSALRVLFLQDEIADRVIELLCAAMAELKIGDPANIDSDIGPVITYDSQQKLLKYIDKMKIQARLIYTIPLSDNLTLGHYVPPTVFQLKHINDLEGEIFGPILHIIRYQAKYLRAVIESINQTHYGLTLGIHSRIDQTVNTIIKTAKVGNIYVNRNMIGATVGVQPFGGEGLSGTGPKAGGPNYLLRFSTERVITNNRSAIGGNTLLLNS